MARKKKDPPSNLPEKPAKEIVPVQLAEQMKTSYLAYAMSVIVGRALPDVRDGLKPVHRRILHAMNERAWRHDRAYVKSAKIVGEVIGNYHPHGDTAVYDTLVRMVQDFAMRVPLIDGQGNFGSIDGDRPAAYRYTEARLTQMAEELLKDLDKDTIDFIPNFDDTKKEPTVLPAAWPALLVNGSSGIAVGMATKIPPHNLNEIISACELLIDNPEVTVKQLMKKVPAPDFPTGGTIIGKSGLKKAYNTGKGSIKIRGIAKIEEVRKGKDAIIVTEIPYEVKKSDMIEKIAKLVEDKKIEGISAIRDESDRTGMRIVFELKRDSNAKIILNQLYKRSNLEVNYGIIFLALVNNEPKLVDLKSMLKHYIDHRKEVVVRRTQYELRKAEERAHILEGLKIALDFIDEVIKIIRSSKTVDEARTALIERFKLSEIQANAILDMRLQKLTSLESAKIIEELETLKKRIAELKDLLGSESKIYNVIKNELGVIKEKYSSDRASSVSQEEIEDLSFHVEDLISNEDEVITLSEGGYIRRVPLDTFRRQHRGGKGVVSGGKKDDPLKQVTFCHSHDFIMLFSNRGKIFYIKVHEIPEAGKDARGKNIKGLLNLTADEVITAIRAVEALKEDKYLVLLTRRGIIKKLALDQIKNAKKGGLMALQFKNSSVDWLVDVVIVENNDDVFLATAQGQALRTNMSKMRSQGRAASGIIGMSLDKDDYMISLDAIKNTEDHIFTVTEKGYGKRVKLAEFATKGRGGKGMAFAKPNDKTGRAVAVRIVNYASESIITTSVGMTLRIHVKDISMQGRSANGVKVVEVKDNDSVSDITVFSTTQ